MILRSPATTSQAAPLAATAANTAPNAAANNAPATTPATAASSALSPPIAVNTNQMINQTRPSLLRPPFETTTVRIQLRTPPPAYSVGSTVTANTRNVTPSLNIINNNRDFFNTNPLFNQPRAPPPVVSLVSTSQRMPTQVSLMQNNNLVQTSNNLLVSPANQPPLVVQQV